MKFLLLLAQAHETFRKAELEALAELYNVPVDLSEHSEGSPFLILDLPTVKDAYNLVHKSILSRSIYEFYGQGKDINSLTDNVKQIRAGPEQWQEYLECSFKFDIVSYQGSRSRKEQVDLINSFAFMGLQGPIRMKNPDETFVILEDYQVGETNPQQMYFGRLVGHSQRDIIDKYDLKRRKYIGTTSFDSELAAVSCNLAKLSPGKIMYDPFAGTGSFLVAAAHCGAMTIGSDIDGRMLRGKGPNANIDANFNQYGLSQLFIDVMTMDFTHNTLRPDIKLDAIVCDPPYGIREGLKILGTKDPKRMEGKENVIIDGVPAHLRPDYIAPKKPYQFGSLLDDLLAFAADRLVPDGRLCFWMPTANEDFEPTHIPHHPDLELVAECVQEFNKWSRRLLSYRRRPYGEKGESRSVKEQFNEEFRDKYFRGFRNLTPNNE
uniref:tRNA (guanine(10)-N(2))-methyltransferase n=1 Tax=Blastobotrys adeninivorans TaxID=409370 RepID=A0A060T4X0_BLAAD